MKLLQNSWSELLILDLVYRQVQDSWSSEIILVRSSSNSSHSTHLSRFRNYSWSRLWLRKIVLSLIVVLRHVSVVRLF